MHKYFAAISVLFLSMFITACSDVTSITRSDAGEVVLNSSAKAYVSIPADGKYEQEIFTGSGRIAAGIVLGAFSTKMQHVDLADNKAYFSKAMEAARKGGYQYLITPEIIHWENRNTAWSGRPAKASISIKIVDVKTGEVIDSVVIQSRTSMVRVTDPSPEESLPPPVQEYVDSIKFIS